MRIMDMENQWTVHVKNFGKIDEAEIQAAPLTLFIGDNNSGALDKNVRGCTDWNEEKLMFDFLGEKEFRHRKIKLDIESGEGIFCL